MPARCAARHDHDRATADRRPGQHLLRARCCEIRSAAGNSSRSVRHPRKMNGRSVIRRHGLRQRGTVVIKPQPTRLGQPRHGSGLEPLASQPAAASPATPAGRSANSVRPTHWMSAGKSISARLVKPPPRSTTTAHRCRLIRPPLHGSEQSSGPGAGNASAAEPQRGAQHACRHRKNVAD